MVLRPLRATRVRNIIKQPTLAETLAAASSPEFWQKALDGIKELAAKPGPNQEAAQRLAKRLKL